MSDTRLLAFAPGQTWSAWALLVNGDLITSEITVTETYLDEGVDPAYLAQLDVYNRRLIGLRRSVADAVDRNTPIDYFVCWNPSPSTSVAYGIRAGQYIGMMKTVCFERGLPIVEMSDDDSRAFLDMPADTPREVVEEAVKARLGGIELPTYIDTYDSGAEFVATPIDAIAVGWAAHAQLTKTPSA